MASNLCSHTGPLVQKDLCLVCSAAAVLKFLILLFKGSHVFILQSPTSYVADPASSIKVG